MESRISIITGASSGIGRAIAENLLMKGYGVVGNARNKVGLAALEAWSKNTPGTFIPVEGDVTKEETLTKLLSVCHDTFGRGPCIGVVNAGRGLPGSITGSDASKWEDMVNLNVLGAFRQLRILANAMTSNDEASGELASRDIVVIGSTIGTNVSPTNHVYGATKFAVHGATEALRRELGPKGVRVSLIQPGFVRTNFQEASGYDIEAFEKAVQEIGPLVEAKDVARTVEFIVDQPPHVHLHDIMLRSTRQSYP
ncbi:putative oxidoreductase [Pseudoalteromonas holothuriae]|uniref:Oxidoreductase n=1 Tax=Pseudoalteromonas holothuriae TaxID=2963714 RepID=A0ABN8UNW0_9GAMM|nr:SDR family oxidoreductase [Pseudoalteromonas sp. CIP111951]CAH9059381.1 putative oxidoreductase [Pseudoalteromonas sp. CIP111951]